jgi:hypothetical protein
VTDIVYIVRPGESNEELRFSLRSLVNVPHDRVWIAGHKPEWVTGVEHIPTVQNSRKWWNARRNLAAAVTHPDLPEFVLFNDDFFVLEPLEDVPVLHRGSVTATIKHLNHTVGPSVYMRGLVATHQMLNTWGINDPLCYSLHVPIPIVAEGMREVLQATEGVTDRLHLRTLYGNLMAIGGDEVPDCKINRRTSSVTGPFLSTSDRTFVEVSDSLAEQFPDPSPYELQVLSDDGYKREAHHDGS